MFHLQLINTKHHFVKIKRMKNEIKIRIKLFLSTKQGVTITQDKLLNIKEASIRATNYTGKKHVHRLHPYKENLFHNLLNNSCIELCSTLNFYHFQIQK
jgi:hypothetical protein